MKRSDPGTVIAKGASHPRKEAKSREGSVGKREEKRCSFNSDRFPYIGVNPINGLLTAARRRGGTRVRKTAMADTEKREREKRRKRDSGSIVSRRGSERIDRRTVRRAAGGPRGG